MSGHEVCPARFAFLLSGGYRKLFQDPDRIVAGLVGPGDAAVDLGCGPGFFTTAMAKAVGSEGRVVAVDVQAAMLVKVEARAARLGLGDRVCVHLCEGDRIGLEGLFDFALAFYMVHEVPDSRAFLGEVRAMLREGGRLLVVEPKVHVSASAFAGTVDSACGLGFRKVGERSVFMSRAVLLERTG